MKLILLDLKYINNDTNNNLIKSVAYSSPESHADQLDWQ